MIEKNKNVIIIAGPTASGKSALAYEFAKRYNGEIVSADSMQIYKGMDIGTAKPAKEEQRTVKHHLIDIISPDETYSVAEWQESAKSAIDDIIGRNKLPIVAGGTGLYINSLVYNLIYSASTANTEFRKAMNDLAQEKGVEALHHLLQEKDPESAAKIHPNNVVRVIRTLEIIEETGETMAAHHKRSLSVPSPWNFIIAGLLPDRKYLYDRIHQRIDQMFSDGLIQEVEDLLEKKYTSELQSMQGIGYKEIILWLEERCSYDDMLENIRQGTRNYAKRQITWFSRLEHLTWWNPTDPQKYEEMIAYLAQYVV